MIRRLASSLTRDARGAAAPFVAVLGVALVGVSGIALDLGLYYSQNRNLQAVTEAAALSAAVDLNNAQTRAISFLAQNGYPASTLASIQVGHYCANKDFVPTARFVTGTAPANCVGGTEANNAVRLTTTGQSQRYLTNVFGRSPIPALSGVATATRIDEAGVEMSTGILGLQPGLVNSLLSLLAGRNISLTQQQIQAMSGANIDAGLMFDALASRVGETGSYANLVARTVPLTDLIAASQTAAGAGDVANALGILAGQLGSGIQVNLAGLFGLGVWKNMPVGGANQKQSLRAGLNAYQLISYALQQNNRSGALSVTLPGVTQVLLAASGTGATDRPRFSFGPAGETAVNTSMLRLELLVTVGNLGGLLNGLGLSVVNQLLLAPLNLDKLSVDVPLLIEIAPGSAAVSSISCGQEAATDAHVGVNASSGFINAYLGQLPTDVLTQPFRQLTAADIKPVPLVNALGLLTVNIRAAIGPVFGANRTLDFRQVAGGDGVIGHPPYSGTAARVGDQSQLGPLLTGLGSNLSINATLLGLSITTGPLINNITTAVLAPITALVVNPLVDPLVNGLLSALGIEIGFADTWVTGVRCGVPVLV